MQIKGLNLPSDILNFYLDSGIKQLYLPQKEAIEKGLLDGINIVAAIPTASGKTLIAELAMLKSITNGGKALYIVPLKALASEKMDNFSKFKKINIKTGISTGDFESKDEWLGSNNIIISTSEKADSLLRNEASWIRDITVIVIDEVHLLDSPNRGPTLEIIIAKLRKYNPHAQVIALSATIGNSREIADWLNAKLIFSEWRPIELKEGVFYADNINFSVSQKIVSKYSADDGINIVIDTLKEKGQCLVFESTRKNCMGFAKKLSKLISKMLTQENKLFLNKIVENLIESSDSEVSKILAQCIKNGVAFHHAGLTSNQRRFVEDGFRDNVIKVICSTPTLAAGLNLPARKVLIRSYKRYDTNLGMQPIPVLDYKQMAGRAGRPHLDPYGESVLIARSYEEMQSLFENYINASPEDIWSKLGTENALRTHVLSTVVNGFASSEQGLMDFFAATFFAYQQETCNLKELVKKTIEFLINHNMLEDKNCLQATPLGKLVSMLYIDPLSAAIIISGLNNNVSCTDLTLIHLVCSTPDMKQLYMRSSDYKTINEYVMIHKNEFINIPNPFKSIEYEWFLGEVKTALFILAWINEKSLDEITVQFNVGEGDIHSFADISQWIMHAVARLAESQQLPGSKQAYELEQRIKYGANTQLLELLSIRNIGRVRARKLFDAGITSVEAIKNTDINRLSSLIGVKIAAKIMLQITGNKEYDLKYNKQFSSNRKQQQRTFYDYDT